jgi:hypothetical protein
MTIHDDTSLIFIHIGKTAGTTLRVILERIYGRNETYLLYPGEPGYNDFNDFLTLNEASKRGIRLYCGHIAFGLHRRIPQPTTYITVLRDPVERTISNYFEVKKVLCDRNKGTEAYSDFHKAARMDLAEFVSSGIMPYLTHNHQVQMLSNSRPMGQCSAADLERAKENLVNHFSIVGLTERFDETLVLMRRRFGWNVSGYSRKNVAAQRGRGNDFPEGTIDLVRECNRLDLELYCFAEELFEKQLADQDAAFGLEVAELKEMNSSGAGLFGLLWKLWKS